MVEWVSMSLIQKLQTDQLNALKKGERARLETIRFIVSQLNYKQIDAKTPLTDDEIVTLIRKQVKELAEAKAQFEAAKREDLVKQNSEQIEILQAYLPAEVDDNELEKLMKDFVESNIAQQSTNPKAFTGRVVGALRSKAAPARISALYQKLYSTQ